MLNDAFFKTFEIELLWMIYVKRHPFDDIWNRTLVEFDIKQPLSEHLFDHLWTHRAENRRI